MNKIKQHQCISISRTCHFLSFIVRPLRRYHIPRSSCTTAPPLSSPKSSLTCTLRISESRSCCEQVRPRITTPYHSSNVSRNPRLSLDEVAEGRRIQLLLLAHNVAILAGHRGPQEDNSSSPCLADSSDRRAHEELVDALNGILLEAENRVWAMKVPPVPAKVWRLLRSPNAGRINIEDASE